MAKIDTSGWKEFKIGKLFEIRRPVARSQAKYEDGNVPFVASGNFNNGVTKWCKPRDDEVLDAGNCITVSPIDGSAFYQAKPFLGRGGAGSAILMLHNAGLTELSGLFVSSVIRQSLTKYTYSDQLNSKTIEDEMIRLPVDTSGEPDWAYMDEYMSAVVKESGASLKNMGKVEKEFHPVNASDWRQFSIGSLFEIEKGTRLTRAAMIDGDTPFIGATLENNGITARVGNTGHVHPGGLMTVAYNGQKATGKAFYQPIPFWASDDVNVLYPKFSLTENIALFLAPLFWEAGRPYSFGDKWGKDVMENDCLTLPANASGEPDWDYMDKYMRTIMESAKSDLAAMQSIRR